MVFIKILDISHAASLELTHFPQRSTFRTKLGRVLNKEQTIVMCYIHAETIVIQYIHAETIVIQYIHVENKSVQLVQSYKTIHRLN